MEAVGARLGRSSTRYAGPTAVFSGPVRKWKKRWVSASPFIASNNSHHHSSLRNGTSNGSNLLFFKWTLFSQNNSAAINNGSDAEKTPTKDDDVVAGDELPRRKFKYIPIAMLEEQMNEGGGKAEDEAKPFHSSKRKDFSEKPDINDVPMEETQGHANQFQRQDLNESTFDLSLA